MEIKKELPKQEIWEKILKELSLIYSNEVFEENFSNIRIPYKIENNTFFILVENKFIKNKIMQIYLKKINEISKKYSKEKIFFQLISSDEINSEIENDKYEKKEEKRINFNSFHQGKLESNYKFDNFVIGESNIFAFKMAKKIAENEKVQTNPLYIFGSVGLGKTHLMQAIGNHIIKKFNNKKVLYIKADGFIEDFTNQLRKEKMEEFNQKYRNIDVLLVDDIQIMSGARRTQIEFFKLFDYLNLNKKQMVVTSDKPISELNNIMERLTNRFKAGLVVDIQKPDSKHRLDILKRKIFELQGENIKLKKEILEFISSHFDENIREMEGALLRLLNYTQIYGLEINLKNAMNSLKPLLKTKKNIFKEELNVEKIKNVVSKFYEINVRDLMSKKKHSKYTIPRHITFYLIKTLNDLSFKMISFLFDRKYSSILKAFKKIKKKIEEEEELKKVIELLLTKINNQ
ncbi:chromosomal replication initiator protein DnaA [Candidatus Phytoplasma phoenicium]|uniref:Chromosomal replication initiator protein DnaA n=1 Tax=Candidatus Phytoplasma phoenicium TaxID=198422 RepID=A0A2S8NUT8_9MOLU|nr:chromosomal replication initiator protein DnaA [Candidatus Phytoplasma phoenicium]